MANFICIENKGLVITTNKVVEALNLQTIKKYVKNTNNIEANQVEIFKLSLLKFFLKIIGISYILEFTDTWIIVNEVKETIKNNHIFNNVVLASRPRIIKVLLKSDMSIIWINIWDVQSGAKAKGLINKCFNVGSNITTIHGMNMNPGVLQCKNCWK